MVFGGRYLQKIHRGIDPDDISNFQKFDFQKFSFSLFLNFWPIRASIPTIYRENKTVCVFFHRAFDGNAKIRRNIGQKFKNNEKLNF